MSSPWLARSRAARACAVAVVVAVSACADRPAPDGAALGPADTQVLDRSGAGTRLQTVTVRRQGRTVRVDFYNTGAGVYRVIATAPAGRGLDRSDARTAYDAAFEAAQQFDCGGQPMLVVADSATYQEEDRRSALTQGAPGWMFQGRCG